MKIWRFHILTDKQLAAKLEQAKAEQRQMTGKMMERIVGDKVLLSEAVKVMRDKK